MHTRTGNVIDISGLKSFAVERLPSDSPLREILVAQDNEMPVQTFLERLPIYLRLARFEENRRKDR